MRGIEFRAWIKNDLKYADSFMNSHTLLALNCDLYIVEQYTGLTDKNGVKIFEGDIVRILYTDWPSRTDDSISLDDYKKSISDKGVVMFNAPFFEMVSLEENRFGEKSSMSFNHGKHGEMEVIGNIHEEEK